MDPIFCLIFFITEIRGFWQRFALLAVGVLVGFAVLTQFADLETNMMHRVEGLLDPNRSARHRTSGRFDLALGGWYIFRENPLGVGTGGFTSAWASLGNREGLSGFAYGHEKASHSGWIKTLAENGFPGILLFTGYVLSFAVVGWRKRRQGMFILGLLATVVLSVAFLTSEFQGKGLWFVAAGVTVLLHREAITTYMRRTVPGRALRTAPGRALRTARREPVTPMAGRDPGAVSRG